MKAAEKASWDLAIIWFEQNRNKSGQIMIRAFIGLTLYLLFFMILPEEIDESLNVP
jgi:hypothetical protein